MYDTNQKLMVNVMQEYCSTEINLCLHLFVLTVKFYVEPMAFYNFIRAFGRHINGIKPK